MLNIPNFLFKAMKYDLGDAVGEQIEDAVGNGAGFEEQNSAALAMCRRWMDDNYTDVAEALSAEAVEEFDLMMSNLEEYLNA